MRSVRWALIQDDWGPYKKREIWTHTHKTYSCRETAIYTGHGRVQSSEVANPADRISSLYPERHKDISVEASRMRYVVRVAPGNHCTQLLRLVSATVQGPGR
jgi:hypothetical protein